MSVEAHFTEEPGPDDSLAARSAALDSPDAIEASPWTLALDALDDTLAGVGNPWTPPLGLGPLPPELEARARDILERQRVATTELESSRAAIAVQLAAVRTLPTSLDQPDSVYLDVKA